MTTPTATPRSASPTDAQIAELRRLAEAATAGPWMLQPGARSNLIHIEVEATRSPICSLPKRQTHNAAYIAAANPVAVLALLDALQAAREAIRAALPALQVAVEEMDDDESRENMRLARAALPCSAEEATQGRPPAAAEERGE